MIDTEVNINQLAQSVAQKLCSKYHNERLCSQYAWWILEAITLQKKTTLLLKKTVQLTPEQHDTLASWIKKQVEDNIPLQYLIGSVPFAACEILVEPPTLIPRQETEEWCVHFIEKLKKLDNTPLRILDLCTGSGCIALSLAKALPTAEIYASDISNTALTLAHKNAKYNKINSVTFLSSDLLQDIPTTLKFDIIISNPPYISAQDWEHVDASVKEWEDPIALLAPDNGLGIVKQIIKEAKTYLQPNKALQQLDIPQLIIEIGYQQGTQVKELLEKENFCNIVVQKDMQGKDRIAVGYLRNEGSTE